MASDREKPISNRPEKLRSNLRLNYPILSVLMLVIYVAGCGSNANNGKDADANAGDIPPEPSMALSDDVAKLGRIYAKQRFEGTDSPQTLISAHFYQYAEALSDIELTELSEEIGQLDISNGPVCRQTRLIHESNEFLNPEPPSTLPDYNLISAGEVLPITTPMGSWHELSEPLTGFNQYQLFVEAALPDDASLHIPGDDFPGVESVAIPTVEQVINFSVSQVESGQIMPDSVLTWQQGEDANSVLTFRFISFNSFTVEESTFDYSIIVQCASPDSGMFVFPLDIQETLDEEVMLTDHLTVRRWAPRGVLREGDALIWVESYAEWHDN